MSTDREGVTRRPMAGEPHDCPRGCHPLRAYDGVSPACSDTCKKPMNHPGPCDPGGSPAGTHYPECPLGCCS